MFGNFADFTSFLEASGSPMIPPSPPKYVEHPNPPAGSCQWCGSDDDMHASPSDWWCSEVCRHNWCRRAVEVKP